jgi:MscS family membrane protein
MFSTTIGLLYDSTAAQLEYVIDEIKKLLLDHPTVYHDLVRVRLESFGESAINISLLTWITTTDFNEYTAVKEELHFAIMRIVEEAGTGFAFPSRTVYQAQDSGVDRARAEEVAAMVATRRSSGELWIPEAPAVDEEAEKARLAGEDGDAD